ncbi:MAG: DsbA family protein [Candidatus Heimdallarchaeaceae archaeon]
MKKNTFPIAPVLGLIVAVLAIFIILQNSGQLNNLGSASMTEEEISTKVIESISNQIGGSPEDVIVKSIEKDGALYKLSLSISGQEYESYVTTDGKYLFPQKINLEIPEPKEIPKANKPEVDLFVMSYCPFGNQAEELMAPVANLLGDNANIELRYVIYNNYLSGYPEYCIDEENKYCSMHGIQEINQGVRELCVQKYDNEKLWSFIMAMNTNTTSEDADEKWEGIAKELGIDTEKISKCQEEEIITLLDNELKLSSASYPVQNPAANNGQEESSVSGSPTLIINGVIYDGDRSTAGYQTAICNAFNEAPEECLELLTEEEVAVDGSCE